MLSSLAPLAVGGIEVPSALSLLHHWLADSGIVTFLYGWQDLFYSLLIILISSLLIIRWSRRFSLDHPSRLQSGLESLVETIDDFVCGMLGRKEGRFYLPFLGSLFVYILLCNLMGLVPFMFAPTAAWSVAPALAALTFVVFFGTALVKLGPIGYFYHLCNEPKGLMWLMAPLFFPIHIIGEVAKPVSLSLRLFGNVLGKDVLLAVFLAIGVTISLAIMPEGWAWALPLPLHVPFMFLGLMLGGIQALVFFLLATVYIQMSLPHGHDEGHGEEAH